MRALSAEVMVPTNHHLEALTSMGLTFTEFAEMAHESSWLGLTFTTDPDKRPPMNRWTALLAALSLATLWSVADVAYEASTGIAKVHQRFGDRIERKDDPKSHYHRVMTWQVIRTMFLAGSLWLSYGVWANHSRSGLSLM
jgi:hypothetical protein